MSTVSNSNSNSIVTGTSGNDSIVNGGDSATIEAGAGDDTIENSGSNVTIDAGADNDYIFNGGANASISGGSGNDTVNLASGSRTVLVAAISSLNYHGFILDNSWGTAVQAFNVQFNSNDTTVNGGKGDDLIDLDYRDGYGESYETPTGIVVEYSEGDGNDLIKGFNSTSKFKLLSGTISVAKSDGKDIFLTIGQDTVTLANAFGLETLNIVDKDENPIALNIKVETVGTAAGDTIINTVPGMHIQALGGNDLIDLDYRDDYSGSYGNYGIVDASYETPTGIVVEYSEGDGNDTIVGFNETSILKIGGGNGSYSKETIGNDIIVTVGDGAITLVGAASLSAVNIDGKKEVSEHVLTIEDTQAIYSKGDEILFTIYGINPAATVEDFDINDKTVTLSKDALGTEDIFIEGEGYNLALATDVITSPMITAEKWSPLTNGTATYTAKAYSGYYTFADNTINYTEAKGGETFTISGIKSRTANNVVVNDKEKIVTLFPTALGTDNVTLESDDYSLQLDDAVTQNPGDAEHKFTAFTNGTATFKIFGDNAYYTLEGNDVYYTAATADKQFTISGLANNLTLENGELEGVAPVIENGNLKFVLSEDALKNSDVTLSGTNCTLELDEGVTQAAEDIAAAWSEVVNGTASYSINGKTKYYTLNNGKVVYHAPTAGELLLTVEGLSANATTEDGAIDGLEVDEDSLTISASAVGKNVALKYNKNDLAVYLDEDVENISFTGTSKADSIVNEGTNISIDGGEGNDFITDNAENNVTINTASGNDTIKLGASVKAFTAQGFGKGDVIELASPASNLVTISGGIKAGNVSIGGVNSIATVNNSWATSTKNIVYKQSTVAGAKLDGTKITYDSTSGSNNLFTISGLSSTVGVSLSGKNVVLSSAALKTGTVSISGGDYKLKLASDVDTVKENISAWTTLTSGNVAYLEGGTGSYYSLSSDKKSVTYNASSRARIRLNSAA